MDAKGWAVAILGILITWVCIIGLGLVLRRFVRRRPVGELLLWGYLVMGLAATHPHHVHRMTIEDRFFPGPSEPATYLPQVVFDFVAMSLTWPILERMLLFSPYVDPDASERVWREALTALLVTVVLAPAITLTLRARDQRSAARQAPLDQA